jgi:hypothetical protein
VLYPYRSVFCWSHFLLNSSGFYRPIGNLCDLWFTLETSYRFVRKEEMDTQGIVGQLRQELTRIDAAIAALENLDGTRPRRGRPPKSAQPSQAITPRRRTMSASARAKIAAAQRARWAKQKGQAATNSKAAVKRSKGGGISAAGRKRLSALMKARWAARKK